MIKLFFGLTAILYVGYRFVQNMRTRFGTSRFLIQLKRDSAVSESYAESLDMTVLRVSIIQPDLDKILADYLIEIANKRRIGDFLIDYVQRLPNGNYLFVTTTDYAESIRIGRRVNTSEVFNLNFVLIKELDKNQYVVKSDLHAELADKNLRSDFAKSLVNLIQG
ncbi:hypothetical protein [Larkinella rosea]|uniref:Uncharacterized protein n=1 Tax=Larkinella rosea TaxID=2025312 RepID=A0A3P1BP91_9BACT|nr:hypothetical protein [Larkinella rosea]RRB02855.1 hypothetical protein EHT25_20675 [Larkinella rosea]